MINVSLWSLDESKINFHSPVYREFGTRQYSRVVGGKQEVQKQVAEVATQPSGLITYVCTCIIRTCTSTYFLLLFTCRVLHVHVHDTT